MADEVFARGEGVPRPGFLAFVGLQDLCEDLGLFDEGFLADGGQGVRGQDFLGWEGAGVEEYRGEEEAGF